MFHANEWVETWATRRKQWPVAQSRYGIQNSEGIGTHLSAFKLGSLDEKDAKSLNLRFLGIHG